MKTRHQAINPAALGAPKGYSNGILAAEGRLLFVAGQVGWNAEEVFESDVFADQFDKALGNILAVVAEAGGGPQDICRMTMFVVDKDTYCDQLREVGRRYRAHMGKHFPAMSLVQVADLLEPGAQVEIEATAVIGRNEEQT